MPVYIQSVSSLIQHQIWLVFLTVSVLGWNRPLMAEDGVSRVQVLNYPDCIELKNATTRVVLGHHVGGRVLNYERDGKNVIYLSPKEADWQSVTDERKREASAGRFDVGPELLSNRGPVIWSGAWTSEVTGPRSAKLMSAIDPKSGLQITREFQLDSNSSHLTVTQIVKNHGTADSRHGFWSRTFAKHGGIGIVPLTPKLSRYPNFYTLHQDRAQVSLKPVDPKIRQVGEFLVVEGPPAFPKMGFDSYAGWVAYQTKEDLLFVQTYPAYPDRVYAEATGMTLSLWYPEFEKVPACEIEPIGPLETVKPGQTSSFTVNWWLVDNAFPKEGTIDPESVAKMVLEQCK
jgi:hypothetical protein